MTVSRRRVLAAIAAAGGTGGFAWTASGAGTTAMLRDDEEFEASLTAGTLDLTIEYEILAGPGADGPERSGTVDGPRVRLPIGALGVDEPSGRTLLTFSLPQRGRAVNNPAALWVATRCPDPAATSLGEALRLTLSYADCETGARVSRIADGSLREVATALRGGRRIDGDPATGTLDCLIDRVCLLAEYELVGYVGSETVDLPLWASATQCRHATPTNPFAGIDAAPCPAGDICTCCRTLGKLELEAGAQPGLGENTVDPGTYAFTEGSSDYGLEIYDTATTDEGAIGVAFRLVALSGDVVPSLCTVAVKGGPGFEQYDRDNGTIVDSADLPGSDDDGLVYAPEGTEISHVTVCVCTPEPEAECAGCTDPSLTNGTRGGPNGSDGKGSDGGSGGRGGKGSDGGSGITGAKESNGGSGGRGAKESDGGPSGRGGPPASSPGGDR
jgi:hypothetical protein